MKNQDLAAVCTYLQSTDAAVCSIQKALTQCKACSPEQGGDGEEKKAAWIESYLSETKAHTTRCLCPDSRVSHGYRPTLVSTIPGRSARTVWIFSHMDVVDPGDRSAWNHDPWTVACDGTYCTGRGVEDNQQAIVSTLLLAKALTTCSVTPDSTLGMVFMADEESGSTYGLAYLLEQHPEYFRADDLYLVPDFGSPDASVIEVAEKASLWLRIDIQGLQCHASTPHKGKNAFLCSSALVVALAEELPKQYPATDPLFDPPISTFVPSMPQSYTQGINILPGKATFHLDCRLLPAHSPQAVLDCVTQTVTTVCARFGCQGTVTTVQSQPASSIDATHPDFATLARAVSAVYPVTPKAMGLGGATVAQHLRAKGYPALVWSCIENTCHAPNERSSLAATKNDSCVFAHLLFAQ